ncbi:hypothetical protein C8N38_10418 [Rhodovulum kholense]|uniref:Transposase n=1 Tax=Rhodovulum kholense TaxID=453584 RepID=A0A8E2VKB7_9RHOB|nr:hypothetical protein C8N38_10418 [Rhodovulum kholense]
MTVSEAKRLKTLDDENAKLMTPLAAQMLSLAAMKEPVSKKVATPALKRDAVAHLRFLLGLSERWACRIAGADRKMVRCRAQRAPDTVLRARLRDLANARRRFGDRRHFVLLCREGEPSGIKRICRLFREEGVPLRKA